MYLVSACLAGLKCRYDGKGYENEVITRLINEGKAVPVCPEQLGGLTTPRVPCEIIDDRQGKVVNKDGVDRTEEFKAGAEKTLAIAKALGVDKAILKSKSPSCGCGRIYDGTFTGTLVEGNGLAAELLIKHGIQVFTELDTDKILK